MVRQVTIFLFVLGLAGCSDEGVRPPSTQSPTLILARVHWGQEGVPGIQIVLVGTADTVRTDSSGVAEFSVLPGKYVVRAYGINRGGPALEVVDFDVEASKGQTTLVDIVDCLPCL